MHPSDDDNLTDGDVSVHLFHNCLQGSWTLSQGESVLVLPYTFDSISLPDEEFHHAQSSFVEFLAAFAVVHSTLMLFVVRGVAVEPVSVEEPSFPTLRDIAIRPESSAGYEPGNFNAFGELARHQVHVRNVLERLRNISNSVLITASSSNSHIK